MELPAFTPPYQGILRLAQCPVLHRLMLGVVKQAATPDSKFWSDKLLHETLYLCALMLAEEEGNHPNSLANAAIGVTQSRSLVRERWTLSRLCYSPVAMTKHVC